MGRAFREEAAAAGHGPNLMEQFQILKRPVVTEKSTLLNEEGKFTFEVDSRATKHQIKGAVETAFSVRVAKINTMIVRGKRKRYGPREAVKPSWKKAVVTLVPGDSITIFEGV